MLFLSSLFLTTHLATLIFARSIVRTRRSNLDTSQGVPQYGVVCETVNETRHLLDKNYIDAVISTGVQNYKYKLQQIGLNTAWPKQFDPLWMGLDGNGNSYTLNTPSASHCDLSKPGLLYMPISYPGTVAPDVVSTSTDQPSGGNVTTDIVVFQDPDPTTGYLNGQYCGILTNSDGPACGALYRNKTLNTAPHGYRQCNDAAHDDAPGATGFEVGCYSGIYDTNVQRRGNGGGVGVQIGVEEKRKGNLLRGEE
ncbi:uncharacterized protein KY384_005654 [Bacidia gigantensis]|uniref:uncharacterized protein n=1 Tax=Bacidia gigantensis TaxID=2732470 RepID=UPI001D0446B1|nr:uncharacterized protein KY384_005654 [Bacidia gigantensis]KAG8530171.1 hypothetical protein KY384_005654 [Bacidia gigantensis]